MVLMKHCHQCIPPLASNDNKGRHFLALKQRAIWFNETMLIYQWLDGGWTTHLKNMRKSNWIIFPGVKIKNVWNHHLDQLVFVVSHVCIWMCVLLSFEESPHLEKTPMPCNLKASGGVEAELKRSTPSFSKPAKHMENRWMDAFSARVRGGVWGGEGEVFWPSFKSGSWKKITWDFLSGKTKWRAWT